MPGYSGNNRNQDGRRWNSGGQMRGRGMDGRSIPDRIPAQRQMISPWESGVAPGMTSTSLLGDFQSNLQNQYLMNRAINRTNLGGNNYNMPNKIRRLDMIGNFDDPRDRSLLSSSNASLMGFAPQNFTSRGSNLQQRLGNTSSVGTPATRRIGSGYYPSDNRRESNNRRQYKQPNRQPRPNRGSRDKPRYSDKKSADSDKDNTKSNDGDAKSPSKDASTVNKEENEEITVNEETPEAKESEQRKERQEESFPAESLFCHICNLDTFATKKGYIRHLEGATHGKMADKFHEKNAALLEYLTISAKFAEMRRKDKLLRTTSSRDTPVGRITEKVILRKYLDTRVCCQQKFSKPFNFHEHKLTVHHLQCLHEKGIKEEKVDDADPAVTVEESDEKINSAKEMASGITLCANDITPYDPKTPFGLQFMEKKVRYCCTMCKGTPPFTLISEHCQSFAHYEKILDTLNKEEEDKMEKERNDKAEALKEGTSEEKEQPSQKYERRNDEDCDSNYSDKNDGKDFLSYEDDEMIILDEEKNEEIGDEPQVNLDEENNESILNEEPQTILDEMAYEPMIEDDIQAIGEDFEEPENVDENESSIVVEEEEEVEESPKWVSPRRSSRVRQ